MQALLSKHNLTPTPEQTDMLGYMRHHIRDFLGTQQPILTARTGFTVLTTSGTNLTQVVSMDVTGISGWSSFANLFDEYRVRKAKLHILPYYIGYGASATSLASMPIIVVVDYDDATALSTSAQAIQYDTEKIIYFGSSKPVVHTAKPAQPEGQPDLAWVTTASPTVPFWFKFYSITTLVPSSASIGQIYLEVEIEFRQLA